MSLFEINNVRKTFGSLTVLHDISVRVNEGEVVAIIGPSGCAAPQCWRPWTAVL